MFCQEFGGWSDQLSVPPLRSEARATPMRQFRVKRLDRISGENFRQQTVSKDPTVAVFTTFWVETRTNRERLEFKLVNFGMSRHNWLPHYNIVCQPNLPCLPFQDIPLTFTRL